MCPSALLPEAVAQPAPPPEACDHLQEVAASSSNRPLVPAGRRPVVGERFSFTGRWFGLPVGSGWIEVKEAVELAGRRAFHIEAQGRSNALLSAFYPIHDVVHSYLDADTLAPLRFEKHQREGTYQADEVVTFDHGRRRARYVSQLNQSVKEIALPACFHDLISVMYWLRAQPFQPPQTATVDLYTDEKIYQTQVAVSGPVKLELLKRGTFPCLMFEPTASFKGLLVKRGRLWAYVTADAARLPLLIKITTPWGPMTAVLDEAVLPQQQPLQSGD
jgi:hypothetical protein